MPSLTYLNVVVWAVGRTRFIASATLVHALFVAVMPAGGEHQHNHLVVEYAIDQPMFLTYAAAPTSLGLTSERLGMARAGAGMLHELLQ